MLAKKANEREYIEATFSREPVVHGAATGGDGRVEEWFESFHESFLPTGSFICSLHEALSEAILDYGMLKTSLVDVRGYGVSIVVTLNNGAQVLVEPFDYGYAVPTMRTSELPEQRTTTELSPLVLRQVDQIVDGINPKLQERLSQFGIDCPGQELVSASTNSAVNDLVSWLDSQSDTVSATVSNDGTLSIAAVFPNDVRLYVEIERDGSTGAAVTRNRRYASDISGNTVADLTPEVILAAVGSI